MRKQHVKNNKRLWVVLILSMLILSVFTIPHLTIYAADDELDDVPEEGVIYTLTYPDGTAVTLNDDSEPLTYQDVKEAMKEENWRLLASDLESDADGLVVLPGDWNINGTIKIVETRVPEGYTEGDVTEQTLPLKDGTATFVNPKNPDPVDPDPVDTVDEFSITYKLNGGEYNGSTADIVEIHKKNEVISIHSAPTRDGYDFDYWEGSKYQPGDKYTVRKDHIFTAQWKKKEVVTPPSKDSGAKTGDNSGIAISLFSLLVTAMALLMVLGMRHAKVTSASGQVASASGQEEGSFYRAKKALGKRNALEITALIGLILVIIIAAICFADIVFAEDGFVINKVDDNGDPVEGAVFDIYGKPEVTWEEIPAPETVTVSGQKTWIFGSEPPLLDLIPNSITVRLQSRLSDDAAWTDVEGKTETIAVTSADILPTSAEEQQNGKVFGSWSFENLPKMQGDTIIQYRVVEDSLVGFKTTYDGNNITNTFDPSLVTSVMLRKVWEDSGHESERPTSITVKLLADGVDTGRTMTLPDMFGYWFGEFTALPKNSDNGTAINYTVEEVTPDGYTSEVTGNMEIGYTITNTYTPASGVGFSFVFASNNSETVPWIAKTKNKTVNDFASAQLNDGTTVYKYLYTHDVWTDTNNNGVKDEGETETVTDTYYCLLGTNYPYRSYGWYASLEASSLIEYNDENEATLISLESSVPVKEDVEKTFVYGCFKPDVTKEVSISGTTEGGDSYSGSFNMTLGIDKTYTVELEPGTYDVTIPFVGDIDMDEDTINSGVASIHAGDTVTMVTTIKLTVSRNASNELECTIDRGESRYTYAEFANDTSIDIWSIWSDSMNSSSTYIGLSAEGSTVTITNCLYCNNPTEL